MEYKPIKEYTKADNDDILTMAYEYITSPNLNIITINGGITIVGKNMIVPCKDSLQATLFIN